MKRKYIMLLSTLTFQDMKKSDYWKYFVNTVVRLAIPLMTLRGLVHRCKVFASRFPKGSCLDTRFPRGELKWTRQRLKLSKGCPIQGTLKVFVVFLVMLVSIEDLLKTFLRPREPSLIFSRRMFLLYLMKIVRRLSKFLRNL